MTRIVCATEKFVNKMESCVNSDDLARESVINVARVRRFWGEQSNG